MEPPGPAGTALQPPIILADGLDVSMYDSVAEAEWSLEAPDVADGGIVGFDARGQPLQLLVQRREPASRVGRWLGLRWETVVIRAAPRAPEPDALAALLSEYLRAVTRDARAGGASSAGAGASALPVLLEVAARTAKR